MSVNILLGHPVFNGNNKFLLLVSIACERWLDELVMKVERKYNVI